MEGFDLTKYQEEGEEKEKIKKILGKVLSGRSDYEVAEEVKEEKQKRCECGWPIEAGQKFCSECGAKCDEVLECDSANKNCEVVEKCE